MPRDLLDEVLLVEPINRVSRPFCHTHAVLYQQLRELLTAVRTERRKQPCEDIGVTELVSGPADDRHEIRRP